MCLGRAVQSSIALVLALAASASAFAPRPAVRALKAAPLGPKALADFPTEVFSEATTAFKTDYPGFAAKGWGPSTKAERWNGRHAMFGWAFIVGTLHAQQMGYIPDPTASLSAATWGPLSVISGTTTISTERAVIMVANVHALFVSVCAAFAPLGYMDTLLIEDGEEDEPAPGVFPAFDTGITPAAEMWNGRMAMMGIVATSSYSLMTGTPFMECVKGMLPMYQ